MSPKPIHLRGAVNAGVAENGSQSRCGPPRPWRLRGHLFRWTRSWMIGPVLALLLAATSAPSAGAQAVVSIKPGMTEAEVRSAWGEPLTARKFGNMTYLYYMSDCLRSCGTHDVVFLEGGQVVDAVVRDSRRGYDGVASSPRDRKPEATVP
jgi:hypothetical protein